MAIFVFSAPNVDLERIVQENDFLIRKMRSSKVLITGGTGFVGSWVWQSLQRANELLNLGIEIFLISRNISQFGDNRYPNVRFVQHDLLLPLSKNLPKFDFVFSSITPSQPRTGGLNPNYVRDITSLGNRHIIQHLQRSDHAVRFFNASSGIIDQHDLLIADTRNDQLRSAYLQAKINLENYLNGIHDPQRIGVMNARLFTFFGPGIPLDAHFAIGNFLGDARRGDPVRILGNPDTLRSYLYPTDMVHQILKSWVDPRDKSQATVASHVKITMGELARVISNHFGNGEVEFSSSFSKEVSIYLPKKPESEPTDSQRVSLIEGLSRWNSWLNSQ